MGNLNKVFAIGNICFDPEIKQVGENTVLNNTLAVNESYKNSGETIKKTEFLRFVAWNQTANVISNYCHKGSQIFIEGSLHTRDWKDKNGNDKQTTEIKVRSVQLLDSKQDSGGGQQQSGGYQQQQNQGNKQQSGGFGGNNQPLDDEIPF